MADLILERWLPVDGYDGHYFVSDLGRVRSEARPVRSRGGIRTLRSRILRPAHVNGYPYVILRRNKAPDNWLIHRLVLFTFRGPPETGQEGCHNDGVKTNCALSNLRWDTRSGNHSDKVAHGTSHRGEANPGAKLTADQVRAIRSDTRQSRIVGDAFGISDSNVELIRARKSWAWLE